METIYRRLHAHVRDAKKEIEEEKGGKFVGEMKYPHGKPKYKIYRFVSEKEEKHKYISGEEEWKEGESE